MRILKTGFFMLLLVLGTFPSAIAQNARKTTLGGLVKIGTTSLGSASRASVSSTTKSRVQPDENIVSARLSTVSKAMASYAKTAPLTVPTPHPNSVVNGGNNVGFAGLTTVDTANTNGFVVTPPDQGLCVGNGYVVEMINLAVAAYSKTGTQLTSPVSLNSFFEADPSITELSDPRCYYDAATQRWFASVINVINFNTGRSNIYLAVSQTSDPTQAFTVYSIDTTDDGLDGTPSDPGCPCFGDQPLLGADAFGIYLSTNEFGLFTNAFNGGQVYALSKANLVAGTPSTLVHIEGGPLAEGTSYSIQPASSSEVSNEPGSGVEYFLSALDFFGTLDNRIAVWAMTNTSSLSQATPNVSLTNVIISSETYGQPPQATQEAGPYPLGQSLGAPEETLNTDDDRMQQVVYASEHLWGALTTVVSDGTNQNAGIAYFYVKPKLNGGVLTAKVQGQNYISISGASAMYPSVAATSGGNAAIAYSLSGTSYFPSAAFSRVNPSHAASVNIVAAGQAPQDDFSGYPAFGGAGSARWGDYSWAVADGNSIWLAAEYIPGNIDSTVYFTDFGTFVYEVQ